MSKNKGGIGLSLILIVVVILLAVVLVGKFIYQNKISSSTSNNPLIPVEMSPDPERKNLQLKPIKFLTLAPPPTSQDCGNGKLRGTAEPNIVWAISPDPGGSVGPGGAIKIWYTDEWPLTLGAGNVSPLSKSPDHIASPNINIGDDTARDRNNLPYFPALFLSDITSDPNSKSGDAENGGKPYKPDEIYGTWKSKDQENFTISKKIERNYKNLGPGADPFPAQRNVNFPNAWPSEPGYGAEIIWRVDNLGLTQGHSYRAEFIIRDGDRQEGDIGQGCTTIKY